MIRMNALCGLALFSIGCADVQELFAVILHGSGGGGSGGSAGTPGDLPPDAGYEPPPPPACEATPVDIDDLYARISADLEALPAAARPFTRYASAANAANAGNCSRLASAGPALSKLLNGTSSRSLLSRPVAVDPDGLTYRFDLRDYGWNSAIATGGGTFADGWEAVLAASPFAVEYAGPDADSAKAMTGTTVPVLALDALVSAAALEDLYYALARVPPDFDSLLEALDVDVGADIESGVALWAGTQESRISRQDRGIERYPIEGRNIGLWRARDFQEPTEFSLFDDPLSNEADSSVAFYPLRNGLLAFAIFDADGTRIGSSDVLLDFNQNDFRARAATSCTQCHTAGPIDFVDAVRPFVEANPGAFEPDVVSTVQAIYPTAEEALQIVQADSSAYRSALIVADATGGSPVDPIGRTSLEFGNDLERVDVAADLLVSVAALEASLSALPSFLSADIIDRDDFAVVYAESACVVHAGNANHPVNCP